MSDAAVETPEPIGSPEPVDLTSERRNRGLSKKAMAAWVGIGYAIWWRAENGDPISEASQKVIADKLGYTVIAAFPEGPEAAAA